MSLTLGEKLRQAREDNGLSISEVAEQTRISSMYLESIENDDYRTLPGGIFNKGFVKSYAKFVGVNEQEALMDYAHLQSTEAVPDEAPLKVYRPEVLTDSNSGSNVPTIIVAVIILALMTGGILFLVNYLRQSPEIPVANTAPKANTNSTVETVSETPVRATDIPEMATLKVEFKALTQPVMISAVSDGVKSDKSVNGAVTALFEPKESLTVNYNKWNADKVTMTINGKTITLPAVPLNEKDKRIEFTISKDNLAQIWTSGAISTAVPAAAAPSVDGNTNTEIPPVTTATPIVTTPAVAAPAKTAVPKPSVPANMALAKTPEAKPVDTPKPPVSNPKEKLPVMNPKSLKTPPNNK